MDAEADRGQGDGVMDWVKCREVEHVGTWADLVMEHGPTWTQIPFQILEHG